MSRTPSYILRNVNLYVNVIDLIGDVESLTIPSLTTKTEEWRGAGMIRPIEIAMGYEKLDFKFTMGNVDPLVLAHYGLANGKLHPLMAVGALQSEDGRTASAVCLMQGFIKSVDFGDWKAGEMSKTSYEVSVREFAFTIDGAPIIASTPYEVLIGGQSQTGSLFDALLSI